MILKCKVCKEFQQVSKADEADEDPRTLSIRRAFRALHTDTCGEGSVAFQMGDGSLDPPDPEAWAKYVASVNPPAHVQQQADGLFSILINGRSVRVCEDCWQPIPPYLDYEFGLTSPESDGSGGTVPKVKPSVVQTEDPDRAGALLHIRKAVCVPCYRLAFARVYPDAVLAPMSEATRGMVTDAPVAALDQEGEWIAAPKPAPTEVGQ